MESKFNLLKEKLGEVADFQATASVLHWDQQTYMPKGGALARANAMSTIEKTAHERFVSDEIGKLLDELRPWSETKGYDSFEAGLIRVAGRDYEKAKKIPSELVAEFSRETSFAIEAWGKAKSSSDFSIFRPHLEKIVGLNIRKADALGYKDSPYDALLDEFEPGTKKSDIQASFGKLRQGLVPIIKEINSRQDKVTNAVLEQEFDENTQFAFACEVVKALGYDLSKGRQDRSAHPFTTGFSINDVRITTRVRKNFLPSALFASMHECGHALYSQGSDQSFERTPLNDGASLGVHESQSRMWENLVGRSRHFCTWLLPRLKKSFPSQFSRLDAEGLYRAVNKSGPSLIRVEADEVTYNLHVMLRFEIECDLLEGKLKVEDAPAAWNEKMEKYIGIKPADDAHGVLQDIHWALGTIGYFPTYTLGNIMSVQFYNKALSEIPDLPSRIEAGDFHVLLDWLRENIHRHGRKYTPDELLQRVVKSGLDIEPYLNYIRTKYSRLYGF